MGWSVKKRALYPNRPGFSAFGSACDTTIPAAGCSPGFGKLPSWNIQSTDFNKLLLQQGRAASAPSHCPAARYGNAAACGHSRTGTMPQYCNRLMQLANDGDRSYTIDKET
jgi:hypothetical protein